MREGTLMRDGGRKIYIYMYEREREKERLREWVKIKEIERARGI